MKKKILIVSVSAGAGHVRAGAALQKTAEMFFPHVIARHIDMMDYVSAPMRAAIVDSYDLIMRQAPELWQFIYDKTNTAAIGKRFAGLTKFINQVNAAKFYELVEREQPDAVLCTHFLPASALMGAPSKHKITAPISIVMTDYDKHALLLTPGLDRYFISTEKMRWKMIRNGIEKNRIVLSGIPVDPVLYEKKSKKALRKKYSIAEGAQVVLVLSGGQGMSKSDALVRELFSLKEPMTILAVAGKNEKLEAALLKLTPPAHHTLHCFGWTNDMDELLRAADVVVSKPGGMTTTECITLCVPLIAMEPIAGQEEENALYILEHNLGRVAQTREDMVYYAHAYASGILRAQTVPRKFAGKIILERVCRKDYQPTRPER